MHKPSFQTLIDDLERSLGPKRFLHVLGVTHTACALAMRHGEGCGVTAERAAMAALLHDRSKPMTPAEIEADCKRRGSEIPEEDRPYPALWHGWHAALLVRQDFGWTEADGVDEIAEAVQFHSTAEAGMGPLAKILFLADSLEPSRDFPGIDELRKLARNDLDEGFRVTLEHKCEYIESRGGSLNPRAVRALDFYKKGAELH